MYYTKRSNARNDFEADEGTTDDITVAGRRFDLVARRPVGGSWVAWVRTTSVAGPSAALERPLLVDGRAVRSVAEFAGEVRSTGPTAAAALRGLADVIRAAMDEATRDDRGAGGPT